MNRVLLSEENQVYRVGNLVERPGRPWSASILRILRHFEACNLPVERYISADNNIQISEFAEGEMVHPGKWTDEALYNIGQLLARLHSAAREFETTDKDVWRPWYLREIGNKANYICCHGDIAPWNTITENGLVKTLVDWECAGPLDPMVEIARVCWLFVQLHDDDLAKLHNLPSAEKRAQQVRIVADGYGLEAARRKHLVSQIIEVIICETAHEAIDPGLTFDSVGSLWGFAWRTRSLYWVWRNRAVLETALL